MTEEPMSILKGADISHIQPVPHMHELSSVFPDMRFFFEEEQNLNLKIKSHNF